MPGKRSVRMVVAVTTAGLLVAAGLTVPALGAQDARDGADTATAAARVKHFPFPGADTMPLHDGSGKYITYGASDRGRKVPYSVHGKGEQVGGSNRIDGDAMPNGGARWVDKSKNIWTPGAFYLKKNGVGRYYLFYTGAVRADRDAAQREGRQQKRCVGVAWSTSPHSGFKSARKPLVCPKTKRWALDADVTRRPNSAIWLTWRDGQRAKGDESALSAMRLKFHRNGSVTRDSRPNVLLRSDRLRWAHFRDNQGVTVIENPSAVLHRNRWYLFYSGNRFETNYYSTGIAYCGKTLAKGNCEPLPGPKRAYFSYKGPGKNLPDRLRLRGLPGNERGPGAMDVYRARGGQTWVTWNFLTGKGSDRASRTGKLVIRGFGENAKFRVV